MLLKHSKSLLAEGEETVFSMVYWFRKTREPVFRIGWETIQALARVLYRLLTKMNQMSWKAQHTVWIQLCDFVKR